LALAAQQFAEQPPQLVLPVVIHSAAASTMLQLLLLASAVFTSNLCSQLFDLLAGGQHLRIKQKSSATAAVASIQCHILADWTMYPY
jgi:hypothetical protein